MKLCRSNAGPGVAQRATSTGQEHSPVAGPPCRWAHRRVLSEISAGEREPRAAGEIRPEGSSTDKRSRRSVLELRHRAVPRGTRPVLGQLFRMPKPAHRRQTCGRPAKGPQ